MLFLTYWFVLFLGLVFPLYWLVRLPAVRLGILVVACAVFHTHFAGPAGVVPIVLLAGITYAAALTRHWLACYAGIAISTGALVFYKYTQFLCNALLGMLFPAAGSFLQEHYGTVLNLTPPLAISFFAFEFIHYLVDVRRGAAPIKNPVNFTLFSIFWPSIVAGPVKRYQDFLPAVRQGIQQVDSHDVAVGIARVAAGMAKKLVADTLAGYLAFMEPHYHGQPMLVRWLFVVAISLRILLDFSGYSDMAIGFARMHGIRLPENFNWPYLAQSLGSFWRRWHISLSLWIRDYVYIALGGGRRGPVRTVANGLLAFSLCGLWHGAGWNFLVWGVYHGTGLAVASQYRRLLGRFGEALAGWLARVKLIGWTLTMSFVGVGWLFFFYPVPTALRMLRLLFQVS